MSALDQLIRESTNSGQVSNTRPLLTQLTKTIAQRVFRDMVAVQETDNPSSQVFGIRYQVNDKQPHIGYSTETGASGLLKNVQPLSGSLVKGKFYQYENAVYVALKNTTFDNLLTSLLKGEIRLYSDAMHVGSGENITPKESNMRVDKWYTECGTRKISMRVTQELMQDMEANGMDSVAIVEDCLQNIIVNEVNKDILSKLFTVSTRYNNQVFGIQDGYVDLSTRKDQIWSKGKDVYAMIGAVSAELLSNTTYQATYVIVSPNIYGLLVGGGFVSIPEANGMKRSHGYLKSGLSVYVDTYATYDYFLVGCKHNVDIQDGSEIGEEQEYEDLVAQLYYTPYLDQDGISLQIARDPNDLQNSILLTTRYGLQVNPFIQGLNVNQGSDWENLAGKSKLSYVVGIKL